MGTNVKPRKKVCPKCGRRLWLREFYKTKTGIISSYCKECNRKMNREKYQRERKKPDGIFMNTTYGRLMEHTGHSLRIHWNENMLSVLKRYYPNTKNEEVAEMLGISSRTVVRKATELGLRKDMDFMLSVWKENILMAKVASKRSEKSGYKKGHIPWNKGITLK